MKRYKENERPIRPYKTTCKKCETEEDLKDMVKLASENITGNSNKRNVYIISKGIENPSDILSVPEKISEQLLKQQKEILGNEKCKSRRVNVMTYLIDEKKYGLTYDEGKALGEKLMNKYEEYPSLVVVSENKGVMRLDHISSNLSQGLRMTQVFSPATVYNAYLEMKERKSSEEDAQSMTKDKT